MVSVFAPFHVAVAIQSQFKEGRVQFAQFECSGYKVNVPRAPETAAHSTAQKQEMNAAASLLFAF